MNDGTQIFHKNWGTGVPVMLSHGWPPDADAWDAQMLFLLQAGYRVIAHDRRGHSRSSQSSNGRDMATYANDQVVLHASSAVRAAKLVRNSSVKVYPGAPHGLCTTLAEQVNADIFSFLTD